MAVEDNGPGFPEGSTAEGFSTLGFRLISNLARKRGAKVSLGSGPGAVVTIRVPAIENTPVSRRIKAYWQGRRTK